jgi:Flp pilus assembly protein TadG
MFTSFLKDKRGVSAIVVAGAMPVLLGFAGLAVDSTRLLRGKAIIANAADQAALSAASVDGQDRDAVARRFFNAQVPESYKNAIILDTLNVSSTTGTGKSAVQVNVTVNAHVKTLIGQIVGLKQLNVTYTTQATREVKNLEVVMALPSGGTMCATKERTANTAKVVEGDVIVRLREDWTCRHFNAMKDGVKGFIDVLAANQAAASLKVGLVPYNVKVKFPNINKLPDQVVSSEPNNAFYKQFVDSEPLSAIVPMTSDMSLLRTRVTQLQQSPRGMAWSRTDLPTLTGGMMLDPAQKVFFGGDDVKNFTDKSIQKVLILMTDGANIGCCFTNWKQGNFDNQYVYQYQPYNQQQLKYCELLKQQNVTIFTILFDVSEQDTGGKFINNIFARCASGLYTDPKINENTAGATLKCKDKQNCYNVSTGDELIAAYRDIAQNFYAPRLTQ